MNHEDQHAQIQRLLDALHKQFISHLQNDQALEQARKAIYETLAERFAQHLLNSHSHRQEKPPEQKAAAATPPTDLGQQYHVVTLTTLAAQVRAIYDQVEDLASTLDRQNQRNTRNLESLAEHFHELSELRQDPPTEA